MFPDVHVQFQSFNHSIQSRLFRYIQTVQTRKRKGHETFLHEIF
jgi:hypothetical protein